MATLNLKDGYRTEVWRLLKQAIQDDPVYEDAGIGLIFFDGDPEAVRDLDTVVPCLRFLPTSGPASRFDESSTSAALVVQVEARLARLDVEDVFNLQEVLESTLNTIGDVAAGMRLVDAGAVTGEILFQQPLRPAVGQPGADNLIRLTGQFSIEVRRPLLD